MAPVAATPDRQFDFGENWKQFSAQALSPERVERARTEFRALLAGIPLARRSFLEIGFGQGLSLLLAAEAGAAVVACDINPKCAAALQTSRAFFPALAETPLPLVVGSILDSAVVHRLRSASPEGDGHFAVVHSWGVLHHTGNLARATAHAAALVRPGGHLVVAIYNRHWSSRPWLAIKWLYVHSPRWVQRALIALTYPVIYAAKWLVTRRDPRQQQRGMDFYYNVVDWVGGYPYEYASVGEYTQQLAVHGFALVRAVPAEVPTGCNEFVFRKESVRPTAPVGGRAS